MRHSLTISEFTNKRFAHRLGAIQCDQCGIVRLHAGLFQVPIKEATWKMLESKRQLGESDDKLVNRIFNEQDLRMGAR